MFVTEHKDYKALVNSLKFMYKNRKEVSEANLANFQRHVFLYTGFIQCYYAFYSKTKWDAVRNILYRRKQADYYYMFGLQSMLKLFLTIYMYNHKDKYFVQKEVVTVQVDNMWTKYFEHEGSILSYDTAHEDSCIYVSNESIDGSYLTLHSVPDSGKYQMFLLSEDVSFYRKVQKASLKAFKRGLATGLLRG